MSIVYHDDWDLSDKGKKDVERHRQKIDNVIRKNIRDVIAEESIITNKNGKKIKIPVRGLKDYRFVYGFNNQRIGGIGQGKGKKGDVIKKQPVPQPGQGVGNAEGDDYLETEVDIDYLIDIMFDDLGLPYIKEKTKSQNLVSKGWKFDTISKVGIRPRIHKHRTIKEAIKRSVIYIKEIMDETNCEYDGANKSLIQSNGDLIESINIIKENRLDNSIEDGAIFIEDDDLRYKQLDEDIEYHSNAVVIAMIDTSGSMDLQKKYLARSLLFWLIEFLRKTYNHVKVKFITHTTTAKVVDEESFFKQGESGGTLCHTAFDLADHLIETEFPVNEWNNYVIYISDGEDWNYNKTINSIKNLINKKINMVAYCETNPPSEWITRGGPLLLDHLKKNFNFKIRTDAGNNYYKDDNKHLLACKIDKKEDVYPCLRHILFKKEGE